MTSGTAFEQIRLCNTVAPGCERKHRRSQQRGGGRAAEPSAGLVDDEHAVGVAVERQADIEATRHDACLEIALVGRLQRIGRMVGERAVELAVHHLERDVAAGARTPPARRDRPCRWPCRRRHATGRIDDGVDERHDMIGERTEQIATGRRPGPRRGWRDPDRRAPLPPSDLISARPVSCPTARAPLRQNFTPLYCAGLCDAVNIAPGASSVPAAKYTRSVDARPRSTTSTPCSMHAANERVDELGPGRAHVAADEHSRCVGEPGEGRRRGRRRRRR